MKFNYEGINDKRNTRNILFSILKREQNRENRMKVEEENPKLSLMLRYHDEK